MDDSKFKQFESLYKRFVDGTRWINERMARGVNVDRDKEDFKHLVIDAMDAMWVGFTDQEKDYWIKVNDAVRIFKGRIV